MNDELRDGDRMRIAVALVALRFKPINQSYEAYALDLRALFASPQCTRRLDERSLESPWRERALALEKNLSELQAKYDSEHTKLLELTSQGTSKGNNTPTPPPLPPPSSKKKGKKKMSVHEWPSCFNLEAALDGLAIPTTARPLSLLTTFTDLDQLTSILTTPLTPKDVQLLLTKINRALEAVGATLRPFLTLESTPQKGIKQPSDILQTLGFLLVHLIETVLPLLSGELLPDGSQPDEYNDILDNLMRTIFHPIIQSFAPLSLAFLHLCVTSPKSIGPKSDVRQDLLNLLRIVFHSVGHPKYKPSCLCESLALEALRELDKLYSDKPSDTTTTANDGDPIIVDDVDDGTLNSNLGPDVTIGSADVPAEDFFRQGSAPSVVDSAPQGGSDVKKSRTEAGDSIPVDYVKESRVARLAKKDALWFLCTVLHIVFAPLETTTEKPSATTYSASSNITSSNRVGTLAQETTTKWKTMEDKMRERILNGLCELLRHSPGAGRELGRPRDSHRMDANVGQYADEWGAGKDAGKGQVPAGSQCAKSPYLCAEKAGDSVCECAMRLAGTREEERRQSAIGCSGGGRDDGQGKYGNERNRTPYRGSSGIDKVARGMLLAVVEQYWLWSSESYSGRM